MPIEVRQLLITSKVGGPSEPEPAGDVASESLDHLRVGILAGCRMLFKDALRQSRER